MLAHSWGSVYWSSVFLRPLRTYEESFSLLLCPTPFSSNSSGKEFDVPNEKNNMRISIMGRKKKTLPYTIKGQEAGKYTMLENLASLFTNWVTWMSYLTYLCLISPSVK